MLTITEIVWGLDAVLFLVCGAKVYQAYRITKDKSVGDFSRFFILGGIGFIVLTTADPLISNVFYIKLFVTIGLFILFVGLAFLAKLATSLTYPKFASSAFWLVMFGNALTVFANLRYYLLAPTRTPFLDPETGIFVVNFPVIVALFIVLISLTTLLVPGAIFLRKAVKTENKSTRVKGLLLGSGLVFFAIGGVMCGLANKVLPTQISHLFLALAFLPFLVGVFYVVERKVPEAIPAVRAVHVAAPKIQW